MTAVDIDRQVVVLGLARMFDGVGGAFITIVLPLYLVDISLSDRPLGIALPLVTGALLALTGILGSAIQPIAGRLSDTIGRRKPFILFGVVILLVTKVGYAHVGQVRLLFAVRTLEALAVGILAPITIALVTDFTTSRTRGSNIGAFNSLRFAGFAVGPIIAGSIVDGGSYTLAGFTLGRFVTAFYLSACAYGVAFVLIALFVSDSNRQGGASQADGSPSLSLPVSFRQRVLSPEVVLGGVAFVFALGITLVTSIQPAINERLGQSAFWFGIQFAVVILAQFLFQVPAGVASDRLGRRPFVLLGLVLLVPTTGIQGFVGTPIEMLLARFGQGVAGALVSAPMIAMIGDRSQTQNTGRKLSVLTIGFSLGLAIGPIASGYFVRYGFEVPFVLAAGAGCVALVLVYALVPETHSAGKDPDV